MSQWFTEEVSKVDNMKRINNILDIKEYLAGKHKILNRQVEEYNGKKYYPRIVILQYAKTILNFETAYLLQNPITITGEDKVISPLQKVYKIGNYNNVDFRNLDKMVKYGNSYEYLYFDDMKNIRSKIINPEDGYPVYDHANNMTSFIEHYCVDNVSYYTIYYPDIVQQWNDEGGQLHQTGQFNNVSGLPIVYKNMNEIDDCFGRSDLEDIISILDNMEDLISKFSDSFYKHHNPIPVVIGQQLKGEGISPNIVGGGINLDDGADAKMLENKLDYKSFESIYNTLKQALLDISNTPAVSLNSQEISNLSEVSIKLLFSLADVKAGLNEKFIREGMQERFRKIKNMLELKGIHLDDDLFNGVDVVFQYARPQNEKDIIDNLKTLREINGISIEGVLEHSPYTTDTKVELEKINSEGNKC